MKITLGVQLANNLACEIVSNSETGDTVADLLQALGDISKGIEANLTGGGQDKPEENERKGLIIPQVKVKGPIREDGK